MYFPSCNLHKYYFSVALKIEMFSNNKIYYLIVFDLIIYAYFRNSCQISEEEQQSVIRKIFQQIVKRPDSFCNYLEGSISEWGDTTKIIYRHYATLYFVFAVDSQESDLGILDLIQVFVESLDKSFENVCELDLIFHSDKVQYILDEIIMAGMVLETNIQSIMSAIQEQTALHDASQTMSSSASATALRGGSSRDSTTSIFSSFATSALKK